MAGHYNADRMSAGGAPAVHAGVNAVVSTITLTTMSSSGSTTVALTPIPAGARIIDNAVHLSNSFGTAADTIAVYTTIGGNAFDTLIPTSAHTLTMRASATSTIGTRHTGSAVLILQFGALEGTGTSTLSIRNVCTYMADERGD